MTLLSKKTIITLSGIGLIFLAMGVNNVLVASQQAFVPPKSEPRYPDVSVTAVTPVAQQASVTAFGEVTSRQQLSLSSQVSGQIIYLSPTFHTGKTLKKGDVIARIEPIIYQQALANANADLADAELALAQEELNSEQAAAEWQQSGLKETPSDLVLRKPQLAAAKARLVMAQQAVKKAQYDLSQTEIIAPFNALVVSRQVQTGSNIQIGAVIADLYDTNLFEISLPLSEQQWSLLPSASQLNTLTITVKDAATGQSWTATPDRVEQHIDTASRQRSLIAVVADPLAHDHPLFPGNFVQAELTSGMVEGLWQLPSSALIDAHTVWAVNDEQLLTPLSVDIQFSRGNSVFVTPVQSDSTSPTQTVRIVNRPLASYLQNMQVNPTVEGIQ